MHCSNKRKAVLCKKYVNSRGASSSILSFNPTRHSNSAVTDLVILLHNKLCIYRVINLTQLLIMVIFAHQLLILNITERCVVT